MITTVNLNILRITNNLRIPTRTINRFVMVFTSIAMYTLTNFIAWLFCKEALKFITGVR